ncbi:unnamed protein product [Nesidiocoris tenuis]|uniref:Uncharacterized protein n=1 Tax=Nesidiocoris tenuis TaxID=355587 RepID=A0A6H5HNH5_9HEMI|nr:unnamed protein product [Nesidiocoris tenuis]
MSTHSVDASRPHVPRSPSAVLAFRIDSPEIVAASAIREGFHACAMNVLFVHTH